MDTHLANYWDEAQDVYTGGHLFGYQLGTLETGTPVYRNFGIPKARYTNYSAVDVDPAGEYLWTVATPFATADIAAGGTYVHRTHIETGVIEEIGPISPGLTQSQAAFGFHVDARGDAWLTSAFGQDQLHVIRNDGSIESFDDVLPQMTDSYVPGQAAVHQNGRWWRWNHQIDSERFLFTMYADVTVPFPNRSGGSIWEFDASQVVGNDFSNAFRHVAWIGGHTLAMAYSEGTVYFARRNDGFSQSSHRCGDRRSTVGRSFRRRRATSPVQCRSR